MRVELAVRLAESACISRCRFGRCCDDALRAPPPSPPARARAALSGLSLAQHGWNPDAVGSVPFEVGAGNLLVELDPRYNVSSAKARKAEQFFAADSSHAANK